MRYVVVLVAGYWRGLVYVCEWEWEWEWEGCLSEALPSCRTPMPAARLMNRN